MSLWITCNCTEFVSVIVGFKVKLDSCCFLWFRFYSELPNSSRRKWSPSSRSASRPTCGRSESFATYCKFLSFSMNFWFCFCRCFLLLGIRKTLHLRMGKVFVHRWQDDVLCKFTDNNNQPQQHYNHRQQQDLWF